jgi:hypothetical protein
MLLASETNDIKESFSGSNFGGGSMNNGNLAKRKQMTAAE